MKKNAFSRVLALVMALIMVVGNAAMLVVSADDHVHTDECAHECPGQGNTHNLVNCPEADKIKVVDAKCGDWGYTLYQCPACDDYFNDDFVEPIGEHDWSETKAPNCTEDGEKKCSICEKTEPVAALGHAWGDWTVAKGDTGCKRTRTCSVCGATEEDGSDEAHTWAETPVIKTEPTYFDNGLAEYTCTVCGATKEVVIRCEHDCTATLEDVAYKAPTCTEDGNEAYSHCTLCDRYYINGAEVEQAATVIDALGHDFSVASPKYVDGGCCYIKYGCANGCDETETREAGHIWVETVRENPTCVKYGYVIRACEDCGKIEKDENGNELTQLPPLGHTTYEESEEAGKTAYTIVPNCTRKGQYVWYCARCDKKCTEDIDPLGCTYKTVTMAATCYYPEFTFTYCTYDDCDNKDDNSVVTTVTFTYTNKDGKEVQVTVDVTIDGKPVHLKKDSVVVTGTELNPKNHYRLPDVTIFNDKVINEVTCTEDGNYVYYCDYCNEYDVITVPATGHTTWEDSEVHGANIKAPTCTDAQILTWTCDNCGEPLSETIEALGHDFSEYVETVDPTCSEKGYDIYKCSRCDETENKNYVDEVPFTVEYPSLEEAAKVHENLTFVEEYRKGTCTVTGLYKYTCNDCGKSVLIVIEGTGHHDAAPEDLPYRYDDNGNERDFFAAKAPTCTEPGWTAQYKCRCGYVTESEPVEALGHDITSKETCEKAAVCSRCGEQPKTFGHDYVVVDSGAADCLNFGWKHMQCKNCDTEYIVKYQSALGHDQVKLDQIDPTCTETGLTEGKSCARCYWATIREIIPATGHHNEAGDLLVDSCLNNVEDRHCADCDTDIAASHNFTDWAEYEANCITPKYNLRVCKDCQYEETEVIGETLGDHDYNVVDTVPSDYHETGKVTYRCSVCGDEYEVELPILEGIGFFASVDNAVVSGTSITDASLIAVTISLDANNVALWGYKFDLNYDSNVLVFDSAEFASDVLNIKTGANDNGKGTVTVAANGSLENTVISENTTVVVLYFRVNAPAGVVDSPITFGKIETVAVTDDSSVTVGNTGYGTTFTVELLLDLNRDGSFDLHDVLELYRIIVGESDVEYDSVVDVDRDGEITLIDYALVYEYLVGSVDYDALVDRLPEA